MNTSTQTRYPWKTTFRTVFQIAVALVSVLPLVVGDVYTSVEAAPAVIGQVLAVSAAVTRVMANPAVDEFLARFIPWLAAEPVETAQ